MFESVLIANRGEIACRIIRTCRRLGIRTVAVYSAADRDALHVGLADEAVLLGPAPAVESYLAVERVLDAARRTRAAAVHPGYGFLAESAAFARAVRAAGLAFVGPSPEAMELMGAKDSAKAVMAASGVPLVPGYHGAEQSEERLRAEAERLGYPLLIKATAGGGGKGMRRVDDGQAFAEALAACRREAGAAFGDEGVLLERLIERPRHVEVQVFADRQGRAVHLFERDCTLQRRHQKVLEEAPAPDLPPELRRRLGEAAVAAARAAAYENAGTVEFLLAPDGLFYFIEMNTRLQVEHPVTEAITGLDLVEWQLRIAAGEPLPMRQDEIFQAGHGVEVRLYAEDPARGFLPSTGRLRTLRLPIGMPGIRVETGVVEGDLVGPYYDPMLAKIVAHGPDRDRAFDLLTRALDATAVAGPATNLAFLRRLVRADPVRRMAADTGWLDRALEPLIRPAVPKAEDFALAALALHQDRQRAAPHSPWDRADGWRLNAPPSVTFRLATEAVTLTGEGQLTVEACGVGFLARSLPDRDGQRRVELDGRVLGFAAEVTPEQVTLVRDGVTLGFDRPDAAMVAARAEAGDRLLAAPMPGKVTRLLVAVGDEVLAGQPLAILEAMKMEHRFEAPGAGRVTAVHVREGEQVEEGTVLLDLDAGEG